MLIVNDNAPHNYKLLTPVPVIRTPFEYLYTDPKLAAIELDGQENFNQIVVNRKIGYLLEGSTVLYSCTAHPLFLSPAP